MLHIEPFIFGPFQENTYVVSDETGEGMIVDPGCFTDEEHQAIIQYINKNQITITLVVNTHCHIDHVLGNQFVKDQFKVPLLIPEGEEYVYKAVKAYAPSYGFTNYQEADIDVLMNENSKLQFGNTLWKILFVPGHSPGHLAFYQAQAKICLGGDVLFYGSIGRTDLPGGDHNTLIKSIHEKIFSLDDEVVVYSGHGPTTTVGQEKKTNPFCALV